MNSVDDTRDNYSIGFNILGDISRAYLMINIAWIHIEFRVTEQFTLYKRVKYGTSPWTEWAEV